MSRRLICAVLGDRAGVAAIEFAIALPVLCMMVFGVYEVTQAIICYYKLVDAASSIADLIGQTTVAEGGVASGDFDNLYSAGQMIMSPSSGTPLKVDFASVTYNSSGSGATVAWQTRRGGAAKISNTTLTSAASTLGVASGSVIIIQATYSFTSPLDYFLTSPLTMTFQAFAIPRNMLQVSCPPSSSGLSCS
ncbi:MAG TPA: TadE/TadG family type IV pilus assembly protein [Stellaceae bacterium]|jgi:Flp pilus assembly protein TadG